MHSQCLAKIISSDFIIKKNIIKLYNERDTLDRRKDVLSTCIENKSSKIHCSKKTSVFN